MTLLGDKSDFNIKIRFPKCYYFNHCHLLHLQSLIHQPLIKSK